MTNDLLAPADAPLTELQMFIGGRWVDAASGSTFTSTNPATGRAWAQAPTAGPADVDAAVRAARAAFEGAWGQTTGPERARLLRRLADKVAEHVDVLARIESTDNGKLLRETQGAVGQIPDYLHYFAGAADKLNGETIPTTDPNYFVYTVREPMGVVAGIVPWNNPLMIMVWKIGPALAAGCSVVIKTSEHTPASALEFARLFQECGFPDGVLNIISGSGATTGAALVEHPGVDKVSFTGSTAAGASVMKGAAEHVAPVTLELGGKSPHIVFADADLDAAALGVIGGIFASSGQMCTAGSRLLVERDALDGFVERLKKRVAEIQLGDPLELATEMGPVATAPQLERVLELIDSALGEGATVACGGSRSDDEQLRDGFFVAPTIFTGVRPDMRIAREEVFGPVLVVLPFDSEEEAISLANDTEYGLASGVWTSHVQRAHRMARALHAGMVWINCYRNVAPNVPFGGVGRSGFGRENGYEAVLSYTQVKSVWVELTGSTRDPFKMA